MTIVAVWLRYLAIWPALPPVGDPKRADVVIGQAFGRNTFPDSDLPLVAALYEKCERDDFETIAALLRLGFDPGAPNCGLAQETRLLMERWQKPVIVQWEIAAAFDSQWFAAHRDHILIVWPQPNARLFTTWMVKQATFELMARQGWRIAIEVAHTRQIVRSYLIVRKLSRRWFNSTEVVVPPLAVNSFDPASVQRHTCDIRQWLLWEIPVRIHHVLARYVW